MKEIPLHGEKGKGLFTLVDDEDYEKANQYRWTFNNGYAYTTIYAAETKKSKNVYLHRLLTSVSGPLTVDHMNGNKIDNRRFNLRVCTQAENNMNKPKQSNNKRKYKGVSTQNHTKKFRAKLNVNGKQLHLGYFKTEEEAAMAYNEAAYIYYGEFANLNKVKL